MSILKFLGFGKETPAAADPSGDTETVRKIVSQLDAMPAEEARYIASFAFILARVANADFHISEDETSTMERIVAEQGGMAEPQAVLAVQIAKSQSRLFGGTENFLVTREFKEISTLEQRRALLDCLFAVSAADDSISAAEEAQVRQIASELGFTLQEMVEVRSRYSDQREVLRGLGPSAGESR